MVFTKILYYRKYSFMVQLKRRNGPGQNDHLEYQAFSRWAGVLFVPTVSSFIHLFIGLIDTALTQSAF